MASLAFETHSSRFHMQDLNYSYYLLLTRQKSTENTTFTFNRIRNVLTGVIYAGADESHHQSIFERGL